MPTLDWLNRASAFNTAARVPYRLLEQVSVHTPTAPSLPARPDPASVRPELVEGSAASTSSARTGITDNLLIQGDNLEALKALLPFYRGQFQCILDTTTKQKKEKRSLFNQNLFGTPKPKRLLQRIPHIATHENDLVLDSFLGSDTTAAVAHKMGRRWIGIKRGEQGGISRAVAWGVGRNGEPFRGGGFRFMRQGEAVFDESGHINPAVRFATLAAFIWQQETGTAFDSLGKRRLIRVDARRLDWDGLQGAFCSKYRDICKKSNAADRPSQVIARHDELICASLEAKPGTPYLGTHYEFNSLLRTYSLGYELISFIKTPQFACCLLFNGILKNKRPASGNVLTQAVLDAPLALHATTPETTAPLLVYGEACRLGQEGLKQTNVTFRHAPYDESGR